MSPGSADELRVEIAAAAGRLAALGLATGTSGNVSARACDGAFDGLLITPSAVPYEALGPHDVVLMSLEGVVHAAPTGRLPSTEWRLHAGVLRRRRDVEAVVHAHPPWATALSCLRRDIPAFHYMVAVAGGRMIRCADYATFGTEALAQAAVEALADRRACLLANHGIVACGASVEAALGLALEVEALAGQYVRALAAGDPVLLSDEEMERVLERFASYGRRPTE